MDDSKSPYNDSEPISMAQFGLETRACCLNWSFMPTIWARHLKELLTTADVYAVIGYYLANRDEIDDYVRQRDQQANQILRDMEANMTPEARVLRTRLLAYQEQQKTHK